MVDIPCESNDPSEDGEPEDKPSNGEGKLSGPRKVDPNKHPADGGSGAFNQNEGHEIGMDKIKEVLKKHGVSDEDAEYYSSRMKDGAVFMSVDDETSGYDPAQTSEVMYGAGGHNRSRPREI